MGDLQGAMPVSKDRNANALANPFHVSLSDGVTAVSVDAATQALLVKHVDASGVIIGDVRITDGADILQVVTAGEVLQAGFGAILAAGSDGANARLLALTAAGLVKVDDGGGSLTVDDGNSSLTVDGTVTANQGAPAALASAWPVRLSDGTLTAALTDEGGGLGSLHVDLFTQSLAALKVSKDANPNSPNNPLYVEVVTATAGDEVHDYDSGANVASGGASNHDYEVSAGKTFNLTSVIVAASGALKFELRTGPVAALETRAVGFTTVAEPTFQLAFDPPIAVPSTATGTVRVVRINREPLAMDVYSTVIGREVP